MWVKQCHWKENTEVDLMKTNFFLSLNDSKEELKNKNNFRCSSFGIGGPEKKHILLSLSREDMIL